MIVDMLTNLDQYRPLDERLAFVRSYIHSGQYRELAPLTPTQVAPGVSAIILLYDTVPDDEKHFEYHKHCIDVQYLIEGEERILFSQDPSPRVASQYNAEKDMALADADEACAIPMVPGRVVLFLPEELHKPGCVAMASAPCRKLVLKLQV